MEKEAYIAQIIFTGSLIFLVLFLVVIFFILTHKKKLVQKNQLHQIEIQNKELEMLKRVIETQETERHKIATNLHDEINPLLVSMKHVLTAQARELTARGFDSSRIIHQNEVINSVIENIQSSTRDLSPRILYKFGLARGINSYLGDIEGVDVRYDFSGESYLEHTETINLNIYRITLELINNIRKYERITKLHVSLNCTERAATLRILHDGEGITNEEFKQYASQSKGIGLNSIIARVKLLEARLDLTKDEDSEIVLEVPLFNARKD